jgi:hypothetical protein
MKANEVKLADLLNGTVQYRVPLFQRRYSWDEAEWDQLWKDISTLYGSDDSETHFIGAVVTAPVADAPERAAKYLLIDGQQRLTTVLVMLKALADVAKDAGDEFVREQIDRHLRNHTKFAEERPKLLPTWISSTGCGTTLLPIDASSPPPWRKTTLESASDWSASTAGSWIQPFRNCSSYSAPGQRAR